MSNVNGTRATSICIAILLIFSASALAIQTEFESGRQQSSLAASLTVSGEQQSPNVDTLVFCPPPFQPALKPWLEHRRQQGHRIRVLTPAATAVELKQQIAIVAAKHKLANLVLIGDAYDRKADPKLLVPTEYVLSLATYKLGAEPDIATDNPFADLDGDGVPDIGIGRIPVDSASELSQFISRVIAYDIQSSNRELSCRQSDRCVPGLLHECF